MEHTTLDAPSCRLLRCILCLAPLQGAFFPWTGTRGYREGQLPLARPPATLWQAFSLRRRLDLLAEISILAWRGLFRGILFPTWS